MRRSRSCAVSPTRSARWSKPPSSSTQAPTDATVGGIGKSLGEPHASVVLLSGVNSDVVVTVAWDISWYQYRVLPESAQPVRLAERGHELEELEPSFRTWNARVEADGRVVPEIARLVASGKPLLTIRSG